MASDTLNHPYRKTSISLYAPCTLLPILGMFLLSPCASRSFSALSLGKVVGQIQVKIIKYACGQ